MFNKVFFKKINWKFLLAFGSVIICPFIYSWIRIFWIADGSSIMLSTISFQNYIQMFFEILAAFILIPLFTYRKEEYNKQSWTLFLLISTVILCFAIIGIPLSQILVGPISSLNPDEEISQIRWYLMFQTLTMTLIIFEQYLMSEIIVDQKAEKAIFLTIVSLLTKIIVDALFLSVISPFEFTLVSISFSSFIALLIISTFLLVYYLWNLKKDEKKHKKLYIKDTTQYFTRGLVPAFELFIRNTVYSLVTLKIVLMLGKDDWNSWNYGGFIYWTIIFRFTSVFEYHLLSESVNSDDNEYKRKLSLFYLIINIIMISSLGILLSLVYLPNISEEEWMNNAVKLSLMNIPVMMIIGCQNIMKQTFISKNKYKYLLYNTLISLFIINIPLMIMVYGTNIEFSLWDNYIIFGVGCAFSTTISFIQYIYLVLIQKDVMNKYL